MPGAHSARPSKALTPDLTLHQPEAPKFTEASSLNPEAVRNPEPLNL